MLGNPPASSAQSTSKVSSPPQVEEGFVKECAKEIFFEETNAVVANFQRQDEGEKEKESLIKESIDRIISNQ